MNIHLVIIPTSPTFQGSCDEVFPYSLKANTGFSYAVGTFVASTAGPLRLEEPFGPLNFAHRAAHEAAALMQETSAPAPEISVVKK